MSSQIARSAFLLSSVASMVAYSATCHATSGAHPPAVSTFDTRASSISLAVRNGFADTTWRTFSYYANFSSTGGNLSAQFGLHYLQLREKQDEELLHGAAASGAGVLNIPLATRFPNGVPVASLNIYAGAVPTVAGSGASNFISFPLTIGVGATISPVEWLSITPWFEVAPSGTLDTRIRKPDLSKYAGVDIAAVDVTQLTPAQIQELQAGNQTLFTEETVDQLIDDAIDYQFTIQVPLRLGLTATARLGERFSINLEGGVVGFGPAFSGPVIGFAGGALVLHWDDTVPSILPAQRRLKDEKCEDIEARFKLCPASKSSSTPVPAPAAASARGDQSVVPDVVPSPTQNGGQLAPAGGPPAAGGAPGTTPTEPPPAVPAPSPPAPVTPSNSGAAGAAGAPPPAGPPPTQGVGEGLPTRTSPYDQKPPAARFE
jgi:hypothetical protein